MSRDVLNSITNTPVAQAGHPKVVTPSASANISLASPTPLLANNRDDTIEKKERRRSRVLDLQRRNLSSPSSPDRRTNPLSAFTSNQLADHYASCIKLSTENKINAKNAFSLQLIDYMSELLKKEKMENFQIASSTLDASAKIYAGRVDFIHAEAYKVLSGLGQSSKSKGAAGKDGEDIDADNVAELDDGDGPGIQKKKKRIKKSRTIETNLKNITVNKFDLEFEVDPMFQVMSAAFDEGGTNGLLLNNLRCYSDTQRLELDSSTSVSSAPDPVQWKPSHVAEPLDILGSIDFDNTPMCAAFKDFKFTNWDASDMSAILAKDVSSRHAFDMDAESEPILPDDDGGYDVPADIGNDESFIEDDGGGGGDGVDVSEKSTIIGCSRAAQMVQTAFEDLTHGSVGSLMQILADKPSDYSYFDKALMKMWAGPAHWKRGQMNLTKGILLDKAQKSKTNKPLFKIDYEKIVDMDEAFKTSKATVLSKVTLARYKKEQTTLPEDLHYDKDRLFRLFLKTNVLLKKPTEAGEGVDTDIENYDYNNENDRENFCADLAGDDDDDNEHCGGFDFNMTAGDYSQVSSHGNMSQPSLAYQDNISSTSLCADKLLSQPFKVAQIDINYARTAKKLDVRRLKHAMWGLLTSPPPVEVMEDQEAIVQDAEGLDSTTSVTASTTMTHTWMFSDLLQKLPEKLSANIASTLSVPIAFVCLLHLANEKTLKLEGENMINIRISQDVVT